MKNGGGLVPKDHIYTHTYLYVYLCIFFYKYIYLSVQRTPEKEQVLTKIGHILRNN